MKTNKSRIAKIVCIVLFMATLFACVFALSACNKHKHSYTEQVTKEATCYSVGEKTFTCSCGDSYTEEIDKLQHSFTKSVYDNDGHWIVCANTGCTAIDPDTAKADHDHTNLVSHTDSTCTVQGSNVYSCACGHQQTTPLDLAPHVFTKTAYDNDGHWIVCANSGCTAVDPDTSKADHQHTTFVSHTDSTCTVQGKDIYSCACGHQQTTPLDLAPHVYTKQEKTTTMHWMACSACGAVDPSNPKVAHGFTVTGIAKDATCTTQGSENIQCSVCEYETTRPTNALGHNFDEPILGDNPNATGHRLLCARCSEYIFVRHDSMDATLIGDDTDCPDGHNKAATCGTNGHQDKLCTVCGEAFHTSIPATGDHQPSDWVTTHGTQHWKVCTVCEQELYRDFHDLSLQVTKEPTCTESGRKSQVCSICGYVSMQGTNIPKLGHDYEKTAGEDPTCTSGGWATYVCKRDGCGDTYTEQLSALKHSWDGEYVYDANGHQRTCSNCGTVQDNVRNHDIRNQVLETAVACGETTTTKYYCSACAYYYTTETVKQHTYAATDDGRVDPTCSEYGGHYAICTNPNCSTAGGDKIWVVDQWYGDHDIIYFEARPATATQDGVKQSYWECVNCGKYFKSHNCEVELTADEIFIYAVKTIEVENLAALQAIAENLAAKSQDNAFVSYDYYKLTLEVGEVQEDGTIILWDENTDLQTLTLPDDVDVTLRDGYVVTLRTTLYIVKGGDDVAFDFATVEILDVDNHSVGEYDLFVEMIYPEQLTDYQKTQIQAYIECGEDWYYQDVRYFNALMPELEDTLVITFYDYTYDTNVKLAKVLVNGVVTAVPNGVLTLTITGDLHIEVIISMGDAATKESVTLNKADTSSNAVHAADANVSYQYVGQYNEYGRIYQNSHLTFTAESVVITKVTITYQNYKVSGGAGEATVWDNTIKAGKDKNTASVPNVVKDTDALTVTLQFEAKDGIVYVDYFATACQTRILEITVEYQYVTTNNFATY